MARRIDNNANSSHYHVMQIEWDGKHMIYNFKNSDDFDNSLGIHDSQIYCFEYNYNSKTVIINFDNT